MKNSLYFAIVKSILGLIVVVLLGSFFVFKQDSSREKPFFSFLEKSKQALVPVRERIRIGEPLLGDKDEQESFEDNKLLYSLGLASSSHESTSPLVSSQGEAETSLLLTSNNVPLLRREIVPLPSVLAEQLASNSLAVGDVIALPLMDDNFSLMRVSHVMRRRGGQSIVAASLGSSLNAATIAATKNSMRIEVIDNVRGITYTAHTEGDNETMLLEGITGLVAEEYESSSDIPTEDLSPVSYAYSAGQEEEQRALREEAKSIREPVIDVLLLFDKQSLSWVELAGGMDVFALSMIAKANLAVVNSGGTFSFALAGVVAINYSAGEDTSDSSYFVERAYNAMERGSLKKEVNELRNKYNADLVSMFIVSPIGQPVGLGSLNTSFLGNPDACWVASDIVTSAYSYTLIHELGHNLGGHHAKRQKNAPGPNVALGESSSGWYFKNRDNKNLCTIMAYSSDGYGKLYEMVPFFSTPFKEYQGAVVGDAREANNIETMEKCAPVISLYKR